MLGVVLFFAGMLLCMVMFYIGKFAKSQIKLMHDRKNPAADIDLIDFIAILSVLRTEQELDWVLYRFGLAGPTASIKRWVKYGSNYDCDLHLRLSEYGSTDGPPRQWFRPARLAVASEEAIELVRVPVPSTYHSYL